MMQGAEVRKEKSRKENKRKEERRENNEGREEEGERSRKGDGCLEIEHGLV